MNEVTILIGCLAVVFFSIDRYQAPYINRYSTTASNYYAGAVLYCISYLGLYFVLCLYPELLNWISDDKFKGSEFSKLPKELIAALALTILLPNTPGIKELDLKLKGKIFKMINIPKEVRLLKGRLSSSLFKVPDSQRDNVVKKLMSKGLNEKNIEFEDPNTIGFKITKICFLINTIQEWRKDDRYKMFSMEFTERIDALINSYEHQCPVYVSMTDAKQIDFSVIEETESSKIQNIIENNMKFCEKYSNRVLDEISELIARALFSRWNNEAIRIKELKAIGFDIKEQRGYFSWDLMAGLFLAIFIIYFVRFTFTDVGVNVVLLTLLISLSYCAAVFWATYLKLNWDFAKRKLGQGRRFGYYLVAMMFTFGTVAVFRIGVYGIESESLDELYDVFVEKMYWQILSAVMTLMLCFFMENNHFKGLRIAEGLSGMVITAALFYFVSQDIYVVNHGVYSYVAAGLAGFVVSYAVPYWFRNTIDNASLEGEQIDGVRLTAVP